MVGKSQNQENENLKDKLNFRTTIFAGLLGITIAALVAQWLGMSPESVKEYFSKPAIEESTQKTHDEYDENDLTDLDQKNEIQQ